MKKFFDCLTDLFGAMARARAASSLARMHRYEEARNVMQEKS